MSLKRYFLYSLLLYSVSSTSQVEFKFNLATAAVLVPNFGIEVPLGSHSSVQLDVLGSFWDSVNGDPYHIVEVFPEYRYYLGAKHDGLFFGGHVGFGMFTMQKPGALIIYDHYQDPSTYSYTDGSYKSGRITFYGTTIGFKKRFNTKWALEIFIGGGLSQSNYKGYNGLLRTDVSQENYRDFNGSGEVLVYRGGLMLTYSIQKQQLNKRKHN